MFVLIYFILLKFDFGKKYFNYLNLLLIFLYGLTTITSLITLVQAFTLNTVLEFTINFALLVYLFHTMLRGTIVWKDFKLGNSPFNELSNETSYYIVLVLSIFILILDLISTAVLRGIIISLLDAIFLILFGRYIFLYRKYLDEKKIDANNKGNFDEVRKTIDETVDKLANGVFEKLLSWHGVTGLIDPTLRKYMELYSSDISKATGIERALEYMGIPFENYIGAINGDTENPGCPAESSGLQPPCRSETGRQGIREAEKVDQ